MTTILPEEQLLENKLYLRGVGDKRNMTENEALKKFIDKDQCEEKQWWVNNKNRARKKSTQEPEAEELLSRPFQFDMRKSVVGVGDVVAGTRRRGKYPIGDCCEAHNGYNAMSIVKQREIEAAGGCIMGASQQIQRRIRRRGEWVGKGGRDGGLSYDTNLSFCGILLD